MGKRRASITGIGSDPLWYKDAIIYEVHVRAFFDSNNDGIGDFPGLTQKLDYLQELGVTAIWLLPFYPSPLKDDGYDIADYYAINPIYGTLRDFKAFLHEAHERHLRVITELVVNHTSDQHQWFQRSRRSAPGSAWRDFYVWSDRAEKYKEARIIFRDFEPSNWSWDPVARAYYWHRFYSHQPDLNFDNPQVHKEICRVLDFWLDLGVDGLRLDAVPYLYEREGTSCENLVETHEYLKTLRRHVDEKYGDRMLLAEANQWPEDAVAYFGSGKGDECHMAFHFPLMPRLFMAVRMEDSVPIVDILEQTPSIPETSQWALFLRNHDELTLEMVTDEERDYMYRVYANDAKARINLGIRRRLAPLLGNDRKRIELLHLLLFSYPGTPFLYYGDEIGMGDNIFLGDRNGVRTPMQWSSDKNAGFSRASPQALYLPIILDPEYHYEAFNVEAQQGNVHSLWWWMKRVLALRKRYQAFGRGSIQFLKPENRKILAFVRRYENETILVVANLSRFSQPVQLDLAEFKQATPIELFGRTEFPAITDKPYFLTLAPHAAFWFSLEPTSEPALSSTRTLASLSVAGRWEQCLQGNAIPSLELCLLGYLNSRLALRGKKRVIKTVQLRDAIRLPAVPNPFFLLVLLLEFIEGDPEEFLMPLGFAVETDREEVEATSAHQVIARLQLVEHNIEGIIYSANASKPFFSALLQALTRRRSSGREGELRAVATAALRTMEVSLLEPAFRPAVQNNTSVIFGNRYFLKLFRRAEPGLNPDLELGRFLTRKKFPSTPPLAGFLEYHRRTGVHFTVGILTEFLPNAKDAWDYTLDVLSRYFERVRTLPGEAGGPPLDSGPPPGDLSLPEMPEAAVRILGTYVESARLLGQRTGELHLALASEPEDRDFAPESFTPFYQRALFQSMRNLAVSNLQQLRRSLHQIPEDARPLAQIVLGLEAEIIKRLRTVYETRLTAKRIRCHGDLHLGQLLYTGKDFVFIDFEGDPAQPLGERRIKRSPLRDVASLLRSFHYVTFTAIFKQVELGSLPEQRLPQIQFWAAFWYRWVSALFLKAYLGALAQSDLLPVSKVELAVLLQAHLLEKVLFEIGYELRFRPKWLEIPLRGIVQLLQPAA
jgi:maltose alpha-D-glucosyltransferase / alpha-amylase